MKKMFLIVLCLWSFVDCAATFFEDGSRRHSFQSMPYLDSQEELVKETLARETYSLEGYTSINFLCKIVGFLKGLCCFYETPGVLFWRAFYSPRIQCSEIFEDLTSRKLISWELWTLSHYYRAMSYIKDTEFSLSERYKKAFSSLKIAIDYGDFLHEAFLTNALYYRGECYFCNFLPEYIDVNNRYILAFKDWDSLLARAAIFPETKALAFSRRGECYVRSYGVSGNNIERARRDLDSAIAHPCLLPKERKSEVMHLLSNLPRLLV